MAAAKESPRQKMINLMYLVFIAMLALNMSKEVLQSFGMISEQVENNNTSLSDRIVTFEKTIDINYEKEPKTWMEKKAAKDKLEIITSNFVSYLNSLPREDMPKKYVKNIKDSIVDYEIMDKPDYYDEKFFIGETYTNEGKEFIQEIVSFRNEFVELVDSLNQGKSDENYIAIINQVNDLLRPDEKVVNRDGVSMDWIRYHYEGFPEVASNTKLTVLKANALGFQAELLSAMIGGQYKINATLANFDAYVVSDQAAYFPGSKFSGKIILGKKSKNLEPQLVEINGNQLDPKESLNEDGAIILDFPVGGIGSREILGSVVFVEGDNEPITIPVKAEYEVINKPNTASVEVVGRNTLFRNYDNEVIISVPGIASNSVKLTTKENNAKITGNGNGLYRIRPSKGKKIDLVISGVFSTGDNFSDTKEFFIRRAPEPTVLFNGKETGNMAKKSIMNAAVSAIYPPAYGISQSVVITSFKVKIGARTFDCSGNRLSKAAKGYLQRAPVGFDITIKDILYAGITSGTKTLGPSITIN
jgi:gliding motility-associated protein GldM